MVRDRFYFYELAVTNAEMLARFCRALHAGGAEVLREDFSGSAALARAWLALDGGHRAMAVDLDRVPLRRAREEARRAGVGRRLRAIAGDATRTAGKADVIAATNFPLGYFHTRAGLVAYLRASAKRLNRGGVFVADLYGGASAFVTGSTTRTIREPGGGKFTYIWEQRDADARTGLVRNSIHFKYSSGSRSQNDLVGGVRTGGPPVPRGREGHSVGGSSGKVRTIRDAFVYHWRLWSIPELGDAMREAGFGSVECHDRLGDAIDSDGMLYVARPDPEHRLDDDWVVYVVGRV